MAFEERGRSSRRGADARGQQVGERHASARRRAPSRTRPLVAAQDRRAAQRASRSAQDPAGTWVISKRPGSRVAIGRRAAERLEEERADVVRLELAGLGPLHLVADLLDVGVRQDVGDERALVQRLRAAVADGRVDDLVEPRPHLGLVAVADRLDQQVREAGPRRARRRARRRPGRRAPCAARSSFSSSRGKTSPSRVSCGDEVPQVADLGLADAVDAAEALLDAVGVPGQVVVDEQVGALEVDAFAGGVGRDQDRDVGVLEERLLGLAALRGASRRGSRRRPRGGRAASEAARR